MLEPYLRDDAFLSDVALACQQTDSLHLYWLGQSGFLILWQGSALLIDPYLSDSLTKKYANTDKPHVRMTERVIDPGRLDFITAVTSSHNHTDHLDGETLVPLMHANPELSIIVPEANRLFAAQRLEVDPDFLVGLTLVDRASVGPFNIIPVPAAHEMLDTDENGNHKFHGYIFQVGDWTIYHSGDCIPFAGQAEILRSYPIDIALLPINGRDPGRGVAGNFSGREAVQVAYNCQVGLVIPMHYDMFEFNTVTPDEFIQTCGEMKQAYQILRNGERISFPA